MTVMILPDVISWAIPRPATIRIMVATMGCILILATRKPFHSPQSTPAATAAQMATATLPPTAGKRLPLIILHATAPLMAITEPTEISVPPVASTMVIPAARIISLLPFRMISITRP